MKKDKKIANLVFNFYALIIVFIFILT